MDVNNDMNNTSNTNTVPFASTEPQKTPEQIEAEKKAAFEAEEAKRKAEFDAKKAKKDEEIQIEWELNTMLTPDELLAAAKNNITTGVERITRRNMKESVAAYIIKLSQESEDLSRNILHPKKNIVNCYRYINRKALGYAEEQMKLTGETPDRNGVFGIDIPDDICYMWAKEYYSSTDIPEDHEDEEKFEPRTYRPSTTKTTKKTTTKKKETPPPPPESKVEEPAQLSML